MNDFIKDIKKPTEEEKVAKMADIIVTMLNSNLVLSLEELEEQIKDIRKKLSEDEIMAIYNLAVYIKKDTISSKHNNKLIDFLDLSSYCQNDRSNLLAFVKATVQDIQETRIVFSSKKWSFQVDKIFARLAGKNPYADEMKDIKFGKENIHIVK